MFNERSIFTKYIELANLIKIIGYRRGFFVVGVRKVVLTIVCPNGIINIVLTKVIYIP